jgi:pimeloyl-ACP methyl ester carboxylesterase
MEFSLARVSTDPVVDLAYQTFGDPQDPPVIMVTGLGAQMISFDEVLCQALADRGAYVVRFDNRDVGASTWLDSAGAPDFEAVFAGKEDAAAYRLEDMAKDVVGLADALALSRFHVVGASLGAMVGQIVAATELDRVLSFTQLSSTTGAADVGQPQKAVTDELLEAAPEDLEGFLVKYVRFEELIGTKDSFDPERALAKGRTVFARGVNRDGTLRQAAAMLVTGDRTARLAAITAPVAILHGDADAMVDVTGGRATANAITSPSADVIYREIQGMNHDIPIPHWATIIDLIITNVARGEQRAIAN